MAPGDRTTVAIHTPQTFYDIQTYYAYDPNGGWKMLEINPDTSVFSFTAELSDGDAIDMDQSQDGSISHQGGMGIAFTIKEGFDFSNCFISNIR